MKPLLPLVTLLVLTAALQAGDLSFAYEGDAALRERLAKLQGSDTPPPIQGEDWLNSEALTLEDLKGKIVVLDFWATWCGPCIASVPHTNEMAEKYKDEVVIIGVCCTRGAENMEETVKKHGIQYPVVKDVNEQTVKAYAINGYPDYYVIDQNGKLVVADCANSQVEAVIVALLKK